jgi:hypothetical protein
MHGEAPYSVRIWRRHSGRDPLVRISDRLEALLPILVLVGAVLALPVAASVGAEACAGRAALAAQQQATRHQAVVTALADAPPKATRHDATAATGSAQVLVRWQHGGTVRQEPVSVEDGTVASDPVPVWPNDRGELVPPVTETDATAVGVGVGTAVWLLSAMGLAGLWLTGRALCDRYRVTLSTGSAPSTVTGAAS